MEESKGRGRGRGASKSKSTTQAESNAGEAKPAGRGRGAHPTGGDRPETAPVKGGRPQRSGGGRGQRPRSNSDDGERPRGGGGGRGGRGGGGGGRPRDGGGQREDQWIFKFHHENFRKQFDYSVAINVDMEIPAKPSKEELLKEPSKEELKKEIAHKEEEIKALTKEKEKLIRQKREKMEGGRIGSTNTTYREQMSTLIRDQKELNTIKRNLQGEMRTHAQAMDDLDKKKRTFQKNMHPNTKPSTRSPRPSPT